MDKKEVSGKYRQLSSTEWTRIIKSPIIPFI